MDTQAIADLIRSKEYNPDISLLQNLVNMVLDLIEEAYNQGYKEGYFDGKHDRTE